MIDSPSRVLAMFAKFWQPRQVKTRLGDQIGYELASQLYLKFVQTLLLRLSAVGDERTLVFTPESRWDEFRRICQNLPWQLSLQSNGDLGQRMSDFFDRQLPGGFGKRVVLIGSDSPTLPTRLIEGAFDVLQHNDIVLGPSCDGGYYLIGLKSHLPAMFSDIDWSTERVLQQTFDQIATSYPNLDVQLLEEWYDVDSLEDIRRLHAELIEEKTPPPALVELRDLCSCVLSSRE